MNCLHVYIVEGRNRVIDRADVDFLVDYGLESGANAFDLVIFDLDISVPNGFVICVQIRT